MANPKDTVRLQVVVDRGTAEKIEELSELLGASTSSVCAKLLTEAINDNEWFLRHIVAPVRRGLDRMAQRKAKEA
jgi:hypothetical protein